MDFETLLNRLARHYGFDPFVVVGKDYYFDLQVMVLPPHMRGRGLGTKFMNELCTEADRHKVVIGTCPEPMFPGRMSYDKERLIQWYMRFGFVANPDEDRYRVTYVRFPR